MNDQEREDEIDIKEIFIWLKNRIWVIILSAILIGTGSFMYTKLMITPIYTSTTKLHIINKSGVLSSLSLSDLQLGTQLTKDYMIIVMSRPVIEDTIENLGLNLTYEQLSSMVELNNPEDTRVLEITIEYPDAYLAKQLVDELASVSAQRISEIMDIRQPSVIEMGHISASPTSPDTEKNTVIGCLAGAFLACAIVVAANLLNDRIRSVEDIEKTLGITTLGILPIFELNRKNSSHKKGREKVYG